METPERIFFVGNSPQGGRLRAHFSGKNLPSSIKIKGTNDNQPVKLRKNSKGVVTAMWTSKNKYASRLLTLQFIDCGRVAEERKYDSCGDVIIDNPKVTINTSKSNITANGGTVTVAWTSVVEDAVDQYCSEKRVHGSTGEWDTFEGDEPTGAGSSYTAVDQPTASANLDYRLRAIYTDGTEIVLLQQTLNVVVPATRSAKITDFVAAYDEASGFVQLSWTVTEEVSVTGYKITRLDPGASTYEVTLTAPNGIGKQQYPNYAGDSGDYSYQIYPIYVGDVQGELLGTASVNIPIIA